MADKPQEDVVIQDHNYDGIREYDNPMPGWWLWILWASIIWAPIYILGLHFSDVIPSYEEDLAAGQEEIAERRQAWEAANPSFEASEEALAVYVGDEQAALAGAELFATNCAACHGPAGGGLIGPNLTDEYWIHGAGNEAIFQVISDGVVAKGMAPWGPILSAEARAQLVAFIRSIEGSNPDGAKGPEGTSVTQAEGAG
ncbi:MAG: c-type cytochrome [Rhodothermales bacterium]|nr:c-type cytochrome [Rhodothermales bacterium]MBO6781330.1 c-type cytochrome [Rhodothermales bacterium]